MSMSKIFEEPVLETVRFGNSILTASGCGCYDEDICPSDYKDCTGDGASCECEINHSPALGNCTPCKSYT